LNAITNDDPAQLPPSVPPLFRDIIYSLLQKNPEKRPSAAQLLSLPELKEAAKRLQNQIREVDPEMAQKMFEEPKKFD
jgi:serine/threonine protein kinase